MTTFTVATPDRMAELGAAIAARLGAGDLVLLNGELGAGKTTLTRAIGETLGIRGTVTSPTFVLARTHPRLDDAGVELSPHHAPPLVHVDAYRLGSAVELDDLDIDFEASIVIVEWGAGLLDGVSDSWLTVDIARPIGGGANAHHLPGTGTGTETETDTDTGADDALDPLDDFDDEAIEPRTVTVTGTGPRWTDMEWLNAVSD
ncbi:tRNA (adenosine(37)-N6)-threonylcarbamoyltransferase complex ATPase subunit type 1 TsaE [Salinibacterium sp. SWN1162]|uniref:tRNA (adenosine(37)-N6)-threonylcarbamoyltransferase complex ATPase subunit type 1 TsaE n=1 Tax=Salinibacterium sp. SWN1162 TaxID=2792053 RepID=UPI0018CD59ED|nr:tRNA (adenosine(37)-N6)-threonylcarbamoyltransferase complex ATPase subunit type 1 TsaE [Salinibacterium sp. SWN1162]MBH0008499.1 tRNA (adenosine(37)-N6)-threonylcarbamoyltransferase complex ATPase subunit type 1 TsaE [Salinibacterium sp. SWN1162]